MSQSLQPPCCNHVYSDFSLAEDELSNWHLNKFSPLLLHILLFFLLILALAPVARPTLQV